jgi:hypothetical protein
MRNLKNDFATSFMKMLKSKPLEHITVTDIVHDCNVSRQAFYYHFDDIYGIVGWIYAQETENALLGHQNIESWQIGYCNLLKWLRDNRSLVIHTHISVQREYIENFMNRVLFDYIFRVVETQPDAQYAEKSQKEFMARFLTMAFNAVAIDWIHTGMKEEPEEIAKNIEMLVKGDITKALGNIKTEKLHKLA